ncbi:MAG: transcriptional regulator [Ferrovibrionaceae bacterium]
MTPRQSYAEKARAARGAGMPDWVETLAAKLDQLGVAEVVRAVGYKQSALSAVISNTYKARTTTIEQAVRGAYMGLIVECPVQGAIGREACLRTQAMKRRPINSFEADQQAACRACPNFNVQGGGNDAQR